MELPDLHAAVPTGGEVQVTFSQTWNGLPVFGSYAIARVRDGDRGVEVEYRAALAVEQVIDALGGIEDAEALSLMRTYLESMESAE